MAIKNGQVANATEVNKVLLTAQVGALAQIQKNNFREMDRYTDNYSNYYVDGFFVEGFGGTNNFDADNSTLIADNIIKPTDPYITEDAVSQRAHICKVYDTFSGTALTLGKWTSGGAITTAATYVSMTNGSIFSSGANALDFSTFPGNSEAVMSWSIANAGTGRVKITDKTNSVIIKTNTPGGASNLDYETCRILIDKTGSTARVATNDGAPGAGVDISSVTSNWYLEVVGTGAGAVTVYNVGYIDGTGSVVTLISSSRTMNNTKSGGIVVWDSNALDSNISASVSSNSGTNWTSVAKNTYNAIGTPGSAVRIKLACTTPLSAVINGSDVTMKWIKFYGGYFE
mgnify:CR=1 FL=1